MLQTITYHKILTLILIIIYSGIYAQDEESIKFNTEGKHRTEKLQINKNITLPKGEITSFSISSLDTTRNYWKSKSLNDHKEIKELIKLLEKGEICKHPGNMVNGVGMTATFKSGYYFDIMTSGEIAFFSDPDTSFTLTGFSAFIKKIEKAADWERFDMKDLEIPESIEITYKKNKKTIDDPILIKEFMSCFKGTKQIYPTSCPFYNSRIYFRYKDKVISAAPAHDSCNTIIINKNYFEMDHTLHKKLIKLLQRYVGFKIGP